MPRRANNNIQTKCISKVSTNKVELTPEQKRKLWWMTYKNIVIIISVIIAILGTIVIAIVTSEKNNDNNNDARYTLLDLGSQGCIPCDNLRPVIASLKTKFEGQININFYDVNTSTKGAELGTKYNVSTIPTLIYLDENDNEVYRSVGYKSQAEIEADFRRLGWIS